MIAPRKPREPKHRLPLHDRALGLLAVRPRSRRELRTRLLRAGFDPEEVESELQRLESVGLLDDRRFAVEFTEHAIGRRLAGQRAVAAALAARGVDRRAIQQALEEVGGDEAARAAEAAEARAPRLSGLPPATALRRLVSYLLRRGYDPAVARRAAADALRATEPAEGPPAIDPS